MDEKIIKNKLEDLAELEAQYDLMMLEKQALIDKVLTPEIKKQIQEIEAEFSTKAESISEKIAALQAEIKKTVIEHGESVRGSIFHAVYNGGRVSWDNKKLEGLSVAIPNLLQCRTVGEPSVTLRMVKKAE